MTLDQNLAVIRKWLWLILLTAVIAGGVSFYVRRQQPPLYKATATLVFGNVIGNPNPEPADITIGTNLANTYLAIASSNEILANTIKALKLQMTVQQLYDGVLPEIRPGQSLLMDIGFYYNDPVIAASIANEIANQLIVSSRGAGPSSDTQQRITQIQSDIQALNDEISRDQQQLTALDNSLAAATTAADIADLTAQRQVVSNRIDTNRSSIATDNAALTPLLQNSQPVKMFQEATVPTVSEGSDATRIGLLGAAVAASVTMAIIMFVTYFENFNVRVPSEIAKTLDLPALATVAYYGKRNDKYREKLVTHQPLRLEVMESYRLLHTRLISIAQKNHGKGPGEYTFIITSPAPGDGKSVISANLAVTAALLGLRVLLMDADLRNPSLHKFFGLPNETGIAKLLTSPVFLPALVGSADASDTEMLANLSRSLENYLQYTDFANLIVLTSGPVNEGSARDLGILFRPEWLATLKACTGADLIIMDTPPCLAVADSSILAAKTNANVILVVSVGKTPISHALKAKAQFTNVGANIEGIVVNMADNQENEFEYKYPTAGRKRHA